MRRTKLNRSKILVMAFAGTMAVSVPLIAQTVDGTEDITTGLNIPKDITVFGQRDPNIRTATAIVNGTIITQTDVDQRFALVLAANSGRIDESEKERLRLQVLRNLIDETLQIQEAAAQKIDVSNEEIEQTYARVASNFKKNPKQFAEFLRSQGGSEVSLKRQIEGEQAWRRVRSRAVRGWACPSACAGSRSAGFPR